jgi:sirohydrochlorin ferrochelatase
MPSAYLLVSHGSRDPRPEIAMQQLARMVSQKTSHLVDIATLEMNILPLHQQMQKFIRIALAAGYRRLKIVPLFLLPGVHVMTDIPAEVALAQKAFGEDIIIELQPYLGSHPKLGKLLIRTKAEAAILLAHGSRRPSSQAQVAQIAASLGAVPAFWSVAPSLDSQVKELIAAGYQEIAILSYFLFAGGITDAIAQSVETLKLQFPQVKFQLTEPLGATTELAELIWDLTNR